MCLLYYSFQKSAFFLILIQGHTDFRKGGKKGEKYWCEKETSIDFLSYVPRLGLNPQPRHVPWLGIQPMTFWSAGPHSNQLRHTGRAQKSTFYVFHSLFQLVPFLTLFWYTFPNFMRYIYHTWLWTFLFLVFLLYICKAYKFSLRPDLVVSYKFVAIIYYNLVQSIFNFYYGLFHNHIGIECISKYLVIFWSFVICFYLNFPKIKGISN